MPKRAKAKLTKLEKLDHEIRLAYRKQERAVEMQRKAERMLRTSASDLARLHKAKRRAEAKAADELVTSTVTPAPAPKLEPIPTPAGNESDPGEVPTFLRREPPAPPVGSVGAALPAEVYAAAHEVANRHNRPASEEAKKAVAKRKREVKKQVLDAELRGQRRKFPPTGKEALAAIRGK
jgi:hypothetical protein